VKIRLTKLAEVKLDLLLTYLNEEWSESSRNSFLKALSAKFSALSQSPRGFPVVEGFPNVRKLVVTKQTTLFYTLDDSTIYIITLFDTRQDPQKVKKELKKYFSF
jgi:plasmid stabilization system protein ParE